MRQPSWRYKANSDGTVVGGIFDLSEPLPEGWHDHPDQARKETRASSAPVQTEVKRKPGRPPKAKSE
jgi:hypothetical protein